MADPDIRARIPYLRGLLGIVAKLQDIISWGHIRHCQLVHDAHCVHSTPAQRWRPQVVHAPEAICLLGRGMEVGLCKEAAEIQDATIESAGRDCIAAPLRACREGTISSAEGYELGAGSCRRATGPKPSLQESGAS